MNILIIEDDKNLAFRIESIFLKKVISNRIKIIDSFNDFLKESYAINSYDIILVDILLWDESSNNWIDIIKCIRDKNINIPIVIISGLNDIWWLKIAFDSWANDYMLKPFRLAELEVRVMKWFNSFLSINQGLEQKSIKYNKLIYDFSTNLFFFKWEALKMSKLSKYVLLLFVSKREQLLTSLYLIEKIWGDYNLVERNLRIVILRLKNVLKPYSIEGWIKNVRGEWYILKK